MVNFNHPKKYHLTVELWFIPFKRKFLKNNMKDLIKLTLTIKYLTKRSKIIKENNRGQRSWNLLCSEH